MSATSIPISGAAPGASSLGLLIYTRDQLLSLASSPLSQTPPDSAAFERFPNAILRTRGNALSSAAGLDEPATSPSPSPPFEFELE